MSSEPDDPDALRAAVERAARAADLLAELDRRIVFLEPGDDVIAELQDGSGAPLRRLTAGELLDLLDALGRG